MEPGCQLVLADYQVAGDQTKAELVKPWVDLMVSTGAFIEDCVSDSAWFGKLGAVNSETFRHYSSAGGYAYYFPVWPSRHV